MDYLFIFPTEAEAAPFRRLAPEAEVLISGVGMAATAATVAHLAERDDVRERGCCVVLAGVAGSYTESVAVGDVVEVASECCVELPERFGRHTTPHIVYRPCGAYALRRYTARVVRPQMSRLRIWRGRHSTPWHLR